MKETIIDDSLIVSEERLQSCSAEIKRSLREEPGRPFIMFNEPLARACETKLADIEELFVIYAAGVGNYRATQYFTVSTEARRKVADYLEIAAAEVSEYAKELRQTSEEIREGAE